MKNISIFLASSVVEFKEERLELCEFVYDLGSILEDEDIQLELFVCENFDNSLQKGRMQEEYNKFIKRPCDIFFNIYGKKAGQYTIEELEIALDCYKNHSFPHIHVGFENILDENESFKNFKSKISTNENINKFNFSSISRVKLELLFAIKKIIPEIQIELELGILKVFGRKILPVKSAEDIKLTQEFC